MTEQEKKINNIENRVDTLEATFKMFMQEMRDRDNQRAEDIRELRQDMKNMQAKHDADMKGLQKDFYTKMDNMDKKLDKKIDKLEAKIESIGNHVRNVSVATIIGVATIAITVIYSILSR